MKAKFIIIRDSLAYVTGEDKPQETIGEFEYYQTFLERCTKSFQQWSANAALVGNLETFKSDNNELDFGWAGHGIYKAPEGLVFEIDEMNSADGSESATACHFILSRTQ